MVGWIVLYMRDRRGEKEALALISGCQAVESCALLPTQELTRLRQYFQALPEEELPDTSHCFWLTTALRKSFSAIRSKVGRDLMG